MDVSTSISVPLVREHTAILTSWPGSAGKPVKYVKKDIKKMIGKGWFLEGHVDQQQTCLITSDETYQQYIQTQQALEERQLQRGRKKRRRRQPGQ